MSIHSANAGRRYRVIAILTGGCRLLSVPSDMPINDITIEAMVRALSKPADVQCVTQHIDTQHMLHTILAARALLPSQHIYQDAVHRLDEAYQLT